MALNFSTDETVCLLCQHFRFGAFTILWRSVALSYLFFFSDFYHPRAHLPLYIFFHSNVIFSNFEFFIIVGLCLNAIACKIRYSSFDVLGKHYDRFMAAKDNMGDKKGLGIPDDIIQSGNLFDLQSSTRKVKKKGTYEIVSLRFPTDTPLTDNPPCFLVFWHDIFGTDTPPFVLSCNNSHVVGKVKHKGTPL